MDDDIDAAQGGFPIRRSIDLPDGNRPCSGRAAGRPVGEVADTQCLLKILTDKTCRAGNE
jgi:hypothetical protein